MSKCITYICQEMHAESAIISESQSSYKKDKSALPQGWFIVFSNHENLKPWKIPIVEVHVF